DCDSLFPPALFSCMLNCLDWRTGWRLAADSAFAPPAPTSSTYVYRPLFRPELLSTKRTSAHPCFGERSKASRRSTLRIPGRCRGESEGRLRGPAWPSSLRIPSSPPAFYPLRLSTPGSIPVDAWI